MEKQDDIGGSHPGRDWVSKEMKQTKEGNSLGGSYRVSARRTVRRTSVKSPAGGESPFVKLNFEMTNWDSSNSCWILSIQMHYRHVVPKFKDRCMLLRFRTFLYCSTLNLTWTHRMILINSSGSKLSLFKLPLPIKLAIVIFYFSSHSKG